MKLQEIIAVRKSAHDLYKSLPVPGGPMEAAQEELTLAVCATRPCTLDDDTRSTYAVAFCRAAVDAILAKKRSFTLSVELRNQTAKLWVQSFPEWTVADVKCFETQLVTGLLPTITLSGNMVADFTTYDLLGFFDKLRAYDRKRPCSSSTRNNCCPNVGEKGWQRPLTDWHRTHKLGGAEHVFASEADCERYWRGLPEKEEVEVIAKKVRRLYGGGSKNV